MNASGIEVDCLGTTAEGVDVQRYTLRNASGMSVRIITYGATVTEVLVPDRLGRLDDVVLGFDHLRQYESNTPYVGCTVGRVAFRITDARFELGGQTYHLTRNAGRHHLHGGVQGLSKVVWQAEPLPDSPSPAVRFSHRSPDGDQGYPGNLDVAAVFTLTDDNELRIDYTATTDQTTPVNLTHHGYFNLAGAGSGDILGHVLQLDADRYSLTDADLIPTGELAPVRGTPLDFTQPMSLGARSAAAGGYDLAYLRSAPGPALVRVATLFEPVSGRRLEVATTSPAIILYTGNYLDGSLTGKGGIALRQHAGVCLETGHLPDAVRHASFPPILLQPGSVYRETCVYRFVSGGPVKASRTLPVPSAGRGV
jgi:aldose 1-epimerase